MTTETPRDTETPRNPVVGQSARQDICQLIPLLANSLHSVGRSQAVAELSAFVYNRLYKLAEYIDYTAPGGNLLGEMPNQVMKVIENALFARRPETVDVLDFYMRAAVTIRHWLIDHLEKVVVNTKKPTVPPADTDPQAGWYKDEAKTKLTWWLEFHREAGNLPPNLLAAHDMMYYGRRTLEETAVTLGKPADVIIKDKDEAIRLLRPLYDKARGKT